MVKGRIVNLNGGVYQVLTEDNNIISVKARGKLRNVKTVGVNQKAISKKEQILILKQSPKVGDIVVVKQDMIDTIMPRTNELIRPDIANVDQILLVFAAKEPEFSFFLLDLFIANILKQKIKPVIVISKIDKCSDEEFASYDIYDCDLSFAGYCCKCFACFLHIPCNHRSFTSQG